MHKCGNCGCDTKIVDADSCGKCYDDPARSVDRLTMSMVANKGDLYKEKARRFINANVWDGEDRGGCKNDRATFDPDDLQELVDDLIDHLHGK